MTGLSLSLLGSFQAAIGDEPLTSFRTLKVQALLIYLAAEVEQAHSREALMTLLWPGMPEASARGNLRQVLYYLRRSVPPIGHSLNEFMLFDHQKVQINPAYPCRVDAAVFKGLLQQTWEHAHKDVLDCTECAGRLRQAIELYCGDFLADFYLSDSNEFEDWAATRREEMRRSALDALEILTEICIRQKDYHQARAFAERQLHIDNLREGAYRQLMSLFALSSRHSEALAAYETCRRLLAEELGMAPTARTTALYEQILAGEVSPKEAPVSGVRGYELKEEIGSGYFGTVQRAIQTPIGREVAIKVIKPEFANHPDFIRRFEAEAQLIARLEHPHIVPLYDYWREPDRAFLVMRLLRGGSLRSALLAGAWPLEKVVTLVEQIAPALNTAHQQGILHRDLKPANILLDEAGNAYLADFGIAIDLDAERSTSSPEYSSPEQILNNRLTPQADIYSLGLVLYEALAGEKPYGQASQAELIKKQVEDALPSLSTSKPELPPQVDRVIQRATCKDPAERYADALALAADLRRAVHTEVAAAQEFPAEPAEGAAGVNPYKGLRAFREEDAEDFFGRDALVEQLVARLSKSRFLAVVGPSGSGKSSVVNAGLIPALRGGALPGSQKWFIAQMTPGTHPLEALEQALLKIAVNPPPSLVEPMLKDERGLLRTIKRILPEGDAHLLLVVDQFEELYTLTVDEKQRDHFIDSLLAATAGHGSLLHVVITLRADFYDRPLSHLPLGALLQKHNEVVLPLSLEELEQAISCPASRVGVRLEAGLVAAIADEVSDQPGGLPLLQYALTELYEARQDHILTRKAYQEMGGIAGALGHRAESLYQILSGAEKAAARQAFLRLVTLGEGVEDTRRRVLRSELESLGEDGSEKALDPVLDLFGRHRLLTFDRDALTRKPTVEVAHEALLREWPRLREWLVESRDDIRLQRRLAEDAAEWQQGDRDEGYLLRGSRLDQFANWEKDTKVSLTPDERTFLEASLEAYQKRRLEEEQRRQRELETARQLVELESARAEEQTRSAGRFRRIAVFLGIALGLAAVLAILAASFGRSATQHANEAATQGAQAVMEAGQRATAQVFAEEQAALAATREGQAVTEAYARATAQAELDQERLDAEEQARIARSRELASLAQLKMADDGELGMLLALEGLRTSYTVDAENALRLSLHATRLQHTLYGHANPPFTLRVSPDGKKLASTGCCTPDGTTVWDIATGKLLYTVSGDCPHYQKGGEELVTLGTDEEDIHIMMRTWSMETGERIEERMVPGVQLGENWYLFTLSPDATGVLVGYGDGRVEQWNALNGELLRSWQAHDAEIVGLVFSPDGNLLATLGNYEIKVWDIQTGVELFSIASAQIVNHMMNDVPVAFSPDGRLLVATGESENEAIVWDVGATIQAGEAQVHSILRGHTSWINAYAFSADGARLVTGADDGARVWSVPDGRELYRVSGHNLRAGNVVLTPDGESLITADWSGNIRVWDLKPSGTREVSTLAAGERFMKVEHSPDGSRFAAVGTDGHLRVWSASSDELLLDIQAHTGISYDMAFSPDSRRIATTGEDNRTVVWDAETGAQLFSIQGHAEGVWNLSWTNYQAVAYSPDGDILATGGTDGLIKLWEAESGTEIKLTQSMTHHGFDDQTPYPVVFLAFSPDGRYLVASGAWKIQVFDSNSGEMVLAADAGPSPLLGISFSPDGRKLAVCHSDRPLRVIDFPASLAKGEPVELYTIQTGQPQLVRTVFSPDGRYLASTSADKIVKVWDAETGEMRFELPGMSAQSPSASFSPDGKFIRTAGWDGTIRKYVVSTDDLIDLAYRRLTRWWRTEECSQYLRQEQCPAPQQEVTQVYWAPTPAEFIGTWQNDNPDSGTYLRFDEDGNYAIAQTLAGLDEAPQLEGTYQVDENNILSFQDEPCADLTGQIRLHLVRQPGQPLVMLMERYNEWCTIRYKLMGGRYVQVMP